MLWLLGLLLFGLFVPGQGPSRFSLAPGMAAAQDAQRVVHGWKRLYYGRLDGEERLLFADRLERGKVALGDIDGDGDPDLLLGVASGRIMVFAHQGKNPERPWWLVNEALPATDHSQERPEGAGRSSPVDVGDNAAPALVDLDADGDLDLIVGNAAGKLRYYRNEGNAYLPQFFLANPDLLGHSFGGNLVPRMVDANGDGVFDLSFGNERGEVYLVLNRGTRDAPKFCLSAVEPTRACPAPPPPLVKLREGDNAAPDWVDWDRDRDLDLMVGKSDGRIAFYRNIGTRFEGAWELDSDRFLILDAGGYAAPRFHDLDGDGWAELILAWDGERIPLYRNRPRDGAPELWLAERNLLGVARLGRFQRRLRVGTGDLDGDGDADLVIGSGSGKLLIYRNLAEQGGIGFAEAGDDILPTPKRAFSAPSLGDLDNDGDLDLLVGDRNGRLELIRNVGTRQQAAWRTEQLYFAQIDVGTLSAPSLSDLDGDGDADLLVGNSLGNVVYYENRGSRRESDFVLRSVRFGGLKVAAHAAPAVFRWDAERAPDVVTGSWDGGLFSAVRNEAIPASATNAWLRERTPWRGIQGDAYSAPHFVDLTGDGRPDLLLATGEGTLALWRYEGSIPMQELAKADRPSSRNALPEAPDGEGLVFLDEDGTDIGEDGIPNNLEERTGVAVRQRRDLPLDPIFEEQSAPVTELPVGRNSFPAFVDLDGDRALDLVVGSATGHLRYFKNLGPPDNPQWRQLTDRLAEYDGGRNAAPAFADLDGDGDNDMLVGNEHGRVTYWENGGSSRRSDFSHRGDVFRTVQVGKNAVPQFADLDGDRVPELLVGNLRGEIYLYRRRAGGALLDYELVERRFVGVDAGLNATPILADITIDRMPELLVGNDQGAILVLQRTGTDPFYSSGWRRNDTFLQGLQFNPGSHPAVADLDGDGDADLFVGSDAGPIRFFRNQALVPGDNTLTGSLDR